MFLILDQQLYRDRTTDAVERVKVAIAILVPGVIDSLKIPSGTYLLFNQIARLGMRVNELQIILSRLFDARERVREIDAIKQRTPVVIGGSSPHWQEERAIHEALRLDFESLYMFGNVALDLWASVAAHIRGAPKARTVTFELFRSYAADPTTAGEGLMPFVQKFGPDILWLSALVRFYRNRFVVHVQKPWQIGSTHSTAFYDFQLSSSLHVGDSSARLGREVTQIADSLGISMPGGTPHLLLFELLMRIGDIQQRDVRKRVLDLYDQHGTLSPSFHTVGDRLMRFLAAAMELTRELALREPIRVDIGAPLTVPKMRP